MKTIKILSLAAAVLIATALPLRSDPPTFSQHDSCCWFASWVQFVYNLKPAVDEFLAIPEELLENPADFKKTMIARKRASKDVSLFPTSQQDLESALKFNASPITKAYYALFKAIRDKNTNLDQLLTQLQKTIQGKQFGTCGDAKDDIKKYRGLIEHPLFTQYYGTVHQAPNLDNLMEEMRAYTNIFTKFILIKPSPSTSLPFTVDFTLAAHEKIRKEHACFVYDLICLVLKLPSGIGHYIVFIKDQYDPKQQWWRCDTLTGNRRVNESEIEQEKSKNELLIAAYRARDCVFESLKQVSTAPEKTTSGATDRPTLMELTSSIPRHPCLLAEPPLFSQDKQKISRGWLASWVQFVHNLRPLVDDFLAAPEQLFTDFETFKKTKIAKKLESQAMIEPKEWVPLENAKKDFFSPKTIEITKAYRALLAAIQEKKSNIDESLTGLQKVIAEGESFGKQGILPFGNKTSDLISHPLLLEYYSDLPGTHSGVVERLMEVREDEEIYGTKIWEGGYASLVKDIILYYDWRPVAPQFTVDLSPAVTEDVKREHACLIYDLIGIILRVPNDFTHYIAFIKNQYDPEQRWWRCDTLSGNKRVSEEEITQECIKYEKTDRIYVYHVRVGEGNLMQLAQVLKDLSTTA